MPTNPTMNDPRPKTIRELIDLGVHHVIAPIYVLHRIRFDWNLRRTISSISQIIEVNDYLYDGDELNVVAVSNGCRFSFIVDGDTEILYRLDGD